MCDRISLLSKSSRKTKGQSRMDNPETLATLGAQYTRRRQSEQKAEHTTEYVTHIGITSDMTMITIILNRFFHQHSLIMCMLAFFTFLHQYSIDKHLLYLQWVYTTRYCQYRRILNYLMWKNINFSGRLTCTYTL
jgi:hypothetical protein